MLIGANQHGLGPESSTIYGNPFDSSRWQTTPLVGGGTNTDIKR